jgi:pimeloyl-ACP methyl ester carboxylesterase
MTRIPPTTVLLVHGAGLDAATFTTVAAQLFAAGATPVVVERRGYDRRTATADLDVHLDDLAGAVDAAAAGSGDGGVVVAGVSGGATLALALALRGHERVRAVVAHEPLVGPAATEQHRVIGRSITDLLADASEEATVRFLERLVTATTWCRLDHGTRNRAIGHGPTVRIEATGFRRFVVAPTALRASAIPITWTVGDRSSAWRHAAAAVAAGAGITVRRLDAVHTPQFEDPGGLAAAILHAGAHP